MAGSKVSDYSIGDSNIQSVMLTLDKAYKGLHQVSLTNYDTTAEPQIAAGSVVECGGALYKFDSNESITGSPSNGTVYIRVVPAGDTITAEYTNTAPTWSDSKQGWYGTGGDANKRYLEFELTKNSSLYTKYILTNMTRMQKLRNVIIDSNTSYYLTSEGDGVEILNLIAGETGIYDFKIKKACSLTFSSVAGDNAAVSATASPFHYRSGAKTLYRNTNVNLDLSAGGASTTVVRSALHVQPCYLRINIQTITPGAAFNMFLHSWSDSNMYNLLSDIIEVV